MDFEVGLKKHIECYNPQIGSHTALEEFMSVLAMR